MTQHNPISVVHIASGDLWAGAEIQLFTLVKTLHSLEDVTVKIILLNHGELEKRLQELNVPVEVLDETNLNGLQVFWGIRSLLNEWQPDIVHTHRIKENILGSLAARLAGNISSLRTVHGAPEHKPGCRRPHKQLFYILDWLIGKYLQSGIIAVSNELSERLKSEFQPDNVYVIENGVDLNTLTIPEKIQNEADSVHYHKKIGLVGRLVPVKRVDLFIKTAKYLRNYHPNISAEFHIYGEGPLYTTLNQLSVDCGVQDIVHFEGHISEIHREIISLDAIMIASDHEGLPMTLLESMALNIPVVAHSVGGITKVCQGGKGAWLVKDNTVENLAKALINCLSFPKEREIRIKSAQTHIRQHYTAEKNAESYLRIYHKLLCN